MFVGVERLAQEELPAERSVRSLSDDELDTLSLGASTLGVDGEHVLFDRQVDGLRVDPGQIELNHERFTVAVGVDRHGRWSHRSAQHLLGESVKATERIGTHQHR